MNGTAAKTLSVLAALMALAGCGHSGSTSTTTTATTTNTTTAVADASGLPADCETYFTRVGELATRLGGPAAAQYQQAMEASRRQWESLPDKQAAAPACRQALAALDQQTAIMNQMGH